MLSILSPSAQQFLNNLNQITDALTRAQEQVGTGLKIQQVSDSPDQVAPLLQARASLDSAQDTVANLGRVKTEVDSGEQALETSVQLFDQVQTLAVQGATSTQTAAQRAIIANQLGGILQQAVGLAGTTVEGRYIFSGDSDQLAPYSYDPTLTPAVSAYQGTASTRVAQDPNGTTFPVALTAQQIFDSADPTTNVFTNIENLITALNNNDTPTIQTLTSGLSTVATYLNTQLAYYGNTQTTVAAATTSGQNLVLSLQTQIGGIQDADTTGAIEQMTQEQTNEEAALQSRAQLPRTTLFDFLG